MSKTIIEEMSRVARECGVMMRSADSVRIESEIKSSFKDVVTEYDKKIQNHAVSELGKSFPQAHFICEEGDVGTTAGDGYTFIIDPIDGTANFIHHYDCSCTSIACTKDGQPIAAVIYDPFRDELFTAERGNGAFPNGMPIRIADGSLKENLVIFGTADYNPGLADRTFEYARSIISICQDLRRTGSGALDLCYVAAGRAGMFFELELALWDYAAGALIVEEAGGICMTMEGEELTYYRPHKCSVIAGNKQMIRDSGLLKTANSQA